jgi:putative ABC transport system ATP-binding protein
MIGLVDRPDEGTIVINGEDVTKYKERKLTKFRAKTIGFIFQGFNLLPTLTALENVALAARYGGLSKKQAKIAAREMLTSMGLAERLNHLPNELDTQNSIEIINMLKDLNKKNNQTFLIVTHNLEVAHACNQIIEMRDGRRIK